MRSDSTEKRNLSNYIIWLLSIIAAGLIIAVIYQNILIKKSQEKPTPIIKESRLSEQETFGKDTQLLKSKPNKIESLRNENLKEEGHKERIADGSNIDKYYAPMLKRLSLSEQETKEFCDFLQKRRKVWNQLSDELNNGLKTEEEIKELSAKMENIAWEYDDQAKKLLGYKRYQQYSEFHNYMGIFRRDPIEEIESQLSENDAMNKIQEDQLITVMAQAFDNFMSFSNPEIKGPPGFRIKLKDKEVGNKMSKDLDSLKENYFTAADAILTENQMKIFKDFIEYQIDIRKTFYKTMK
jgi:hypothetical protein